MKRLLCTVLLGLSAAALPLRAAASPEAPAAGEVAPPLRVVSINMLTDQWLLLLARPGQLASVTWLTHDPKYSPLWEAGRRVPANFGSAEEVLRFKPDLVFAGRYAATATVAMLRRLGVRVVVVDYPETFEGIADQGREIARLLGVPETGERLARQLLDRLARVRARQPAQPRRVLEYGQNGWTHGSGTVLDLLLRETGHRNLAAERGVRWMEQISLEELLRLQPDGVIVNAPMPGSPALAYALYDHAAFARLGRGGRIITLPGGTTDFGGPFTIEALEQLSATLRTLPAGPGPRS
jgi:iron complex transport system substrate-binding protein